MKKLFSVRFTNGAVHFSLLVLRVGLGLMLLTHGIAKLMSFSAMYSHFSDPLHIGSHLSLMLVLIAEIICAALLVIGLFTRPAALIIFAEMCIILLTIHYHAPFSMQELAWHYLIGSVVILLCGAGRVSVDSLIS